ncbi:Response regulator [Hoeflea phototrophica DFL-43]|jgi:two-component system phosphate regulon response regulator OmpR|uniref:Response regulator n=1 Tax=Hoeflea phototrophica (strain DSM 17068 / NCIMB 14078 / DFL-43) TaxID=411684 RepID=A9D5A2_HOEPD|nr:response regulator [Hoeflea phototrophica]EDQ34070.1 Response regulator [Hoeflea phototrophica DFL-43]
MNVKSDRVIVVDDDPELRTLLRRFLSEHGFETRAVDGGTALDRELSRSPADAIVLDLMMSGEDGLAICRRLRAAGDQTPIIMLTARGDPIDRIVGLETGADDYLAKPFEPRELVARLSAVLRRTRGMRDVPTDDTVTIGPLEINFSTRMVTRDGASLKLSSREFALLAAMVRSRGRPLSRAQLIERALGRDAEVTDRAVDVQIARLRRALGDRADDAGLIKTVWGVGYVLVSDGA